MSDTPTSPLDSVRTAIRKLIRQFARFLNSVSGGKITPNMVTIVGLLAHVPIAFLIAGSQNLSAALLLIIFGLFDTLDGELARLQKSASARGMLLDAVTDRFKEVLIYSGAAYYFISTGSPYLAVWAVIATGASLSVSYVKAKGEAAYLSQGHSAAGINNRFKQGILSFELRISLVIVGLLFNRLSWAIIIIALLASYTAVDRLIKIFRQL